MELRSNSVEPVLVEELDFGGRKMDFVADEVYTASDGRIFVSGVITDANTLADKQYFIEVTDPDFAGFADKNWKEQGKIFEQKIEAIIEQKVAEGKGAFVISAGDEFPDIQASMKEHAVPPEPVKAPEPEGPKSANLQAGEPMKISAFQGEPELIEGFELNGRTGDLVVHDIEFDNGKPFLTGTFAVGNDAQEFAVAIDADRFPDVTSLTNDQVKMLTSGEALQEMIGSAQHPIVLSAGEAFPDRAKLLSDINGIQSIAMGGFNGDIPSLALLGQDYPELVDTMRLFENSYAPLGREDGMIKIAVVEHLGITDPALRVKLIDQTNGLGEFVEKLNQSTDLFSRGPETRAAVAQIAELADSAANFNKPPKLGAGARLFAGLTGVGTAMTAAAASASTYEGYSMEELTHQQFADGVINEAQRDALLEFHGDTTNAQLADAAIGAADQFVLPSLFVTMGVELRARDALTTLANETGLPESVYQMHARSMFGGHTASHTVILEATSELPREMEGQPEALHGAISLNNSLRMAQVELTNFRTPYAGNVHVPDDIQEKIEAREALVESLENRLVGEMEALMMDPSSYEIFMDMLPLDEKMDFVRALVAGDENVALENPLVARATQDYMEGGLDHEKMMDAAEAKQALMADGGAGLNAYIASRILPDAAGGDAVSVEANAEVAHPTSDAWDETLVAKYYNPETLEAHEGIVVENFRDAHDAGLSAPEVKHDIAARAEVSGPGMS